MLATLLRPDGRGPRARPRRRGGGRRRARPRQPDRQLASVDEDLSGRENLILLGRLLGLNAAAKARAGELLDAFGIAEAAGRLVELPPAACGADSTSLPASP